MSALRKIMTKQYGTFVTRNVVRIANGTLPMDNGTFKPLVAVNAFNIGMVLAGGMTWQWMQVCFWGLALALPIASRDMRPKPVPVRFGRRPFIPRGRMVRAASFSSRVVPMLLLLLFAGAGTSVAQEDAAVEPGLHEAVREGLVVRVMTLLDEGADPNALDDEGNPPLLLAAIYGDVVVLETLLAREPDVDGSDASGYTPLMYAALVEDVEMVEMLLEAGATVDAGDDTGNSALTYALSTESTEVIGMLLDAGAALDYQDDDGWTPIITAVANENLVGVKLLLQRGADPNDSLEGWTPLMWAAMSENVRLVEFLLERGADPCFRDAADGLSALDVAEGEEYTQVAKRLRQIDCGAVVGSQELRR